MNKDFSFIFFGTSQFSIYVLEALAEKGLLPKLIVTFPDKPQGRNMILTPNIVKDWAHTHAIPTVEDFKDLPPADVYIVASYGKILPKEIIDAPAHKTLNVHPSLLPKLRGPAPIQQAILTEQSTGVTIMRLNEKMDEGPIIAQKDVSFLEWPIRYTEAEKTLGKEGGELLAQTLSEWILGNLPETPQEGSLASYTKKIRKEDSDITNNSSEVALRKIKAFEIWPRARVGELIVNDAHIEQGTLVIDTVIPPGKKAMAYKDYLRGKAATN
jgi:methionyl-tRNA formyltransferase